MSDDWIQARLAGGEWRRLHPGIYATFSGPQPPLARYWAALLHCGAGSVLSHESAAELAGLVDATARAVHVTIPHGRQVRQVPGVVVHRSRRAGQARHPTQSPARTRLEETVLDLVESARDVDQALGWLARACGRRLTTPDRIVRALGRRRRFRWRREVLAALRDVAAGCHSLLELRYLRDVERPHGLPAADRQSVRQRRGGRWYDDVRYRGYATVVELDGRVAHPAEARARDRRRDNAATVDGLAVLRYDTADVTARPCETAAQVAAALRRNGWTGSLTQCGRATCSIPTP
nr:hypothetical protein [Micromonospora sp. DSM 115978]